MPQVEFEYEVDGAAYRSRQLDALSIQVAQRQKKAQIVIDGLRSNPTLQVYYDPKAPWDAFLRHGPKSGFLAPFLMGFVFVCTAVAMTVFLPHSSALRLSGSRHPDYLPPGMYLPKTAPGQTNVVRYVVRMYVDGHARLVAPSLNSSAQAGGSVAGSALLFGIAKHQIPPTGFPRGFPRLPGRISGLSRRICLGRLVAFSAHGLGQCLP